jgi:hypothetical protein
MPKRRITTTDEVDRAIVALKQFGKDQMKMYAFKSSEERADGSIVHYETVDFDHAINVIIKLLEKFAVVIDLNRAITKKEVLDLIADNEGWEKSRDLYAEKLGIEPIYISLKESTENAGRIESGQ